MLKSYRKNCIRRSGFSLVTSGDYQAQLITGPPNGPVLFCLLASVVVVVCRSL